MVTRNEHGLVNLLDADNFADEMPYDALMEYPKAGPVVWHDDANASDGGFWAVTRHADVIEVSRDSELWSSYEKTSLLQVQAALTPEEFEENLPVQRMMLINMDPPEHTRLRSIVNKGFTPRVIAAFEDKFHDLTVRILDAAIEKGKGDFVVDVAAELPLEVISEMMGVPSEDRGKIFNWSNTMLASDDPEYQTTPEAATQAAMELYAYAEKLGSEARACPEADRDDIIHKLVHAEVDGWKLNETEFEVFILMLSVAGNETTRNAISHGMQAFFEHPDQWELFKKERPLETMADEVIRWATPVMNFQRTATRDTVLGGQDIKEGDRVVIEYSTANRDPDVFDEPFKFDIMRNPNPHIAFGGGGAHYCLGTHLAKLEIQVMFNEIANRMPDIRLLGDVSRLRSLFINGIKHIPVSYVG